MQTPLVSIIIPTYNRAHLIGDTLDSVLAQTYTHWECIVVDDGSTDDTDDLLASYCKKDSRFQYYHRPKDRLKGGNAARNYGFELSKGEFIQWFDDDDVMLYDFLKLKTEKFTEGIAFVYCDGYYVDSKLLNRREINIIKTESIFKDYVLWNLHILPASVLFRKSFLKNKKMFDSEIIRFQDIELFSRLFFKIKTKQYDLVQTQLFLYRRHDITKTEKCKVYSEKNKESIAFCHIENFKRSFILKDEQLIHYFYKKTIKLLFSAIKNDHERNIYFLLKHYKNLLIGNNIFLLLKINILINMLFFYKSPINKVEDYLKCQKIYF